MNISVKQLQGWIQEIEEGAVGTLVSKTNTIYFIRIHKKNHRREGGCGPLGRPLNPPMSL